jgi:beta-lactamase regulating signal transducer with metallopeptidase domain
MDTIFLKILNMTITASWLILAVILVRLLFKKAPKWVICLLWALVAIRLVCPVSIESVLSLVPSAETIPADIQTAEEPEIRTGIGAFNSTLNPMIREYLSPRGNETPEASQNGNGTDISQADPVQGDTKPAGTNPAETNPAATSSPAAQNTKTTATPMQNIVSVLTVIWLAGVAAMTVYAAVSYIRLKHRVKASYRSENGAFFCDDIDLPFILGIIRPRIYIPSTLNGRSLENVLAHEKTHIKRGDHLWKPLGFLLLSVYWFNPLCWLAYILLCRDIEMACDERVIRDMSKDEIAEYSQTLLECSTAGKRYYNIAACPLAFGAVDVKQRIKGILNYKKPAFWVIIAALAASVVLMVFLMTNPKKNEPAGEPTATPTGSATELSTTPAVNGGIPVEDRPDAKTWRLYDYKYPNTEQLTLEEYPGDVFSISDGNPGFTVTSEKGTRSIMRDFPNYNFDAFICDLTGDGKPEICLNASNGSGIVDQRVYVYEHTTGRIYVLEERMKYDYMIQCKNGKMSVRRTSYIYSPEKEEYGTIIYRDGTYKYISDDGKNTKDLRYSESIPEIWIQKSKTQTGSLKITMDEYPGEVFELSEDMGELSVSTGTEKKTIYKRSVSFFTDVFLCDLTYDGKRDFCIGLKVGAGHVDSRVLIYDHSTGAVHELESRLYANYELVMKEGWIFANKYLADSHQLAGYGGFTYINGVFHYTTDNGSSPLKQVDEPVETPEYDWVGKDISDTLFDVIYGSYMFASGAGGWRTTLKLNSSGYFTGEYSGKGELELSEGTATVPAICLFEGRFGEVKKVSDFVYSVKITKLEYDEPGKTFARSNNEICITAEPYGLMYCSELLIYLKGCEKKDIPERALGWFAGPIARNRLFYEDRLTVFGIYNVTENAPDPYYEGLSFVLYE